ncbi:MAG: outer membrane beta-barrel protein [Flavobacteriales bacterium]
MKTRHFFLLLLSFGILFSAQAQVRKFVQNLPKYDRKPYHFGFTLGLTNTTLHANFTDVLLNSELLSVDIKNVRGFNVGIVSDVRLNSKFNLRFVPSLTLVKRQIDYTFLDGIDVETLQKSDEAALFFMPLTLKLRAQRRGNFRPYIFSGSHLVVDMSSDKNVEEFEILSLKSSELGVHLGLGMDFYLEYFKLGLEMKYNYGFSNLLVEDNSNFTKVFDSLNHRGLQFSLTFE